MPHADRSIGPPAIHCGLMQLICTWNRPETSLVLDVPGSHVPDGLLAIMTQKQLWKRTSVPILQNQKVAIEHLEK